MPQVTIRHPRHRYGFTLLELIISVALVLVLMLAITKIFSITSTTIGASQGIAAAVRDARAAQAVFARDLGAMAPDSPFVWIRYDEPIPAFRNAADATSDRNYDPAAVQTANGTMSAAQAKAILDLDIDGDGVEGTAAGETTGDLQLNTRNHRLDRFSFFARDRFSRNTGNSDAATAEMVSNLTSSEAWITYGHLVLPRNDGLFKLQNPGDGSQKTNPGDGNAQNNPNNFYASQWTLGRMAMLMVLPNNAPSVTPGTTAAKTPSNNEYITDANGNAQEFYKRKISWNNDSLRPLDNDTTAAFISGGGTVNLRDSRYDLVGIDVQNATTLLKRRQGSEISTPGSVTPWYSDVLINRFEVSPFATRPITPASASQQAPIFLPACSQFIVEYAGDFVSQTDNGSLDPTAANGGLTPDGKIDFLCKRDASGNVISRQVQWFGFPRSVTGQATVRSADGDVTLVGDFVHYISGAGAYPTRTSPYTTYQDFNTAAFATFEHFGSPGTATVAKTVREGTRLADTRSGAFPSVSGTAVNTVYAAWGPDSINSTTNPRPKLYRITLTIDRPEMAGRSADGQTFEYVFSAP